MHLFYVIGTGCYGKQNKNYCYGKQNLNCYLSLGQSVIFSANLLPKDNAS